MLMKNICNALKKVDNCNICVLDQTKIDDKTVCSFCSSGNFNECEKYQLHLNAYKALAAKFKQK